MMHWYVIQTKLKKERTVVAHLSKASYEVFFPQIKGLKSSKALFPSYLFIRANFEDHRQHRMVRYTRGIHKILGDKKGPQAISNVIIETLKGITQKGQLLEQELLFKEGDRVLVKRGILKDLRGIIEKNLAPTGRVSVLFKWLSGDMRADLKYTDLGKEE